MTDSDVAIVNVSGKPEAPAWQLKSLAGRVPAKYVGSWRQADEWLSEANRIHAAALAEAKTREESARKEGFEAGMKMAMNANLELMGDVQQRVSDLLQDQESRSVELAVQLILKILPELDQQQVIEGLILKAMKVLNAERYIVVYVAAESVGMAKEALQRRHGLDNGGLMTDVVINPDLGLYDCIVQSDLGTIHCGVHDQLNRILEQIDARGEPA